MTTKGFMFWGFVVSLFIVMPSTNGRAAQLEDEQAEPLKPSPLLNRSNPTRITPLPFIPKEIDTVYFASGSSTLTDEAKKILDQQIVYFNRYPYAPVNLEGHADWIENQSAGKRQAKDDADFDLGYERALAVKTYLASKGIEKNRLLVTSVGSKAILPNDMGSETQAKLRYVEIFPHSN